MEEKTLFRIALACSLVGVAAVVFVSAKMQPERISIEDITNKDEGKEVSVEGKIASLYDKDTVKIITLEENGATISVVSFAEGSLDAVKGDVLEVEGRVKNYKGKLEIEAKKITRKN